MGSDRSISRGGSLYRSLAVPFSVFVLVATLALAAWLIRGDRQESLRRLEQMATTNAGFIDELRLPRSTVLAGKLSRILGVEVGFHGADGGWRGSEGWTEGLEGVAGSVVEAAPKAVRISGYDLAAARIPNGGDYLVLARPGRGGWAAGMRASVLVPAASLTLACGCLALLAVRRIVRPLGILTGWLPNLRRDDPAAAGIPAEVSRRGDEIGVLARTLEETRGRLLAEQERRRQSERLAVLGRVATGLAHEIRNPVAAIRLHADLVARGAGGEDSLALIREEADQVDDLVNQWLFVARPAPPETGARELVGLVREVGRRLRAAFDHAGARLTVSAAGPVMVDCDRARIGQVVRNLLVNAMQAMPDGGEVRADVEADGGEAVLTIRDSGPGFSAEARARFGEPFFSEREGGMGLGLTLAREVVAAHRGRIEVVAGPGGGAVCVRLPLAESPTIR